MFLCFIFFRPSSVLSALIMVTFPWAVLVMSFATGTPCPLKITRHTFCKFSKEE
jgi:hypothetical protein